MYNLAAATVQFQRPGCSTSAPRGVQQLRHIQLALLYVIITVVRNVLEPKLLGKQIGLHPLVMLICMYVGLKVFGFIGLFILPIIAAIMKYLYDNNKIHFFRQ